MTWLEKSKKKFILKIKITNQKTQLVFTSYPHVAETCADSIEKNARIKMTDFDMVDYFTLIWKKQQST